MNEENIVFNSEDVQNNKVMGILAYFGILFPDSVTCKDKRFTIRKIPYKSGNCAFYFQCST